MLFLYLLLPFVFGNDEFSEKSAVDFVKNQNILRAKIANKGAIATWNYKSNLTETNKRILLETSLESAKEIKKLCLEATKYPWKTYQDETLKRQFKKLTYLGSSALSEEKQKELEEIHSDMTEIYSKAKVCDYKDKSKCDLNLEPEIEHLFSTSRDPEELKHLWASWRHVSGKKYREKYIKMIALLNEVAKLNNFTNAAEQWQDDFESETFEKDIEDLLNQVSPLYNQLHAFVRRKLYLKYGEDVVPKTGPIPAHLLGNMWAQDWVNIWDVLNPFPDANAESQDAITLEMKKQNFTSLKMFKMAEEFFTSLNLSAMPPLFWEKSIIEKPKGVELTCHASAWDFYDGKDFRIKQCTSVKLHDFLVIHHEMGHIQYFIQYKDQPYVFRRGANSGFHEAIGDIMSLSVGTDKHLEKIGLKKSEVRTKEKIIESLLKVALSQIAFLPFGYLIDQYRWDIFKGKTKPENFNCDWWSLREKYQGVNSPLERNEDDFDAGAKYHVPANVPYVRYFVSHILLFQFHESLCKAAEEYDPSVPEKQYLHECDIFNSKKAGNLLGQMLRLGSSKPWPEALEMVTGTKRMDAAAVLNYFKPLYDWLVEENKKTEEYIGWKITKPSCT